MDVVPETSSGNLIRLPEVRDGPGAAQEPGGPPVRLSAEQLGASGELKLYAEFGQLHLLADVEGVPSFDERLIDGADLERLAEAEES